MNVLKKNYLHSSRFIIPLTFLVIVVCIFFWKVVLRGWVPLPGDFVVGVYYPWIDYKWGYAAGVPVKNPITTDVVSLLYPMQTLAVDMLKNGEWPLWNPYILGGTPLLANFQSAPFSPTNIVYFFLDLFSAWSIQIILQHILDAFFVFLLLRHFKVSKLGSFIGGIVFAFSGFNLIWSQWNGHALTASFIPLYYLALDRFLEKGRYKDGLLSIIALSLQTLSGYPQIIIYTIIGAGLLWLTRIRRSKIFIWRTLCLGLFALLSFGLVLFQILPGAELLSMSQRELEQYPFDWAFLPLIKTITFVAPDYFGNHATQNYWGPQDYTSNTGFVGVIALSLSVLALKGFKKPNIKFSALISVVALGFSFPTFMSIYLWKSGYLGLQSAAAHRALVLWNLGIALLAGFGADYLRKKKVSFKYLMPVFVLLISYWIYTLFEFYTTKGSEEALFKWIPKYSVAIRNLIFPSAVLFGLSVITFLAKFKFSKKFSLILLFPLIIFELFRFGWKFTPIVPRDLVFPTTPVIDFLIKQEKPVRVTGSRVIPINLRSPYNLESLEGYDALYPLNMAKLLAANNSGRPDAQALWRYGTVDNETSRLMDLTNTKYYLTIKTDKENNPSPNGTIPDYFDKSRFSVAFEDKTTVVLESASALPRAFLVYDWSVEEDETKTMGQLINPEFSISQKILLFESPPIEKAKDGSGIAEPLIYKRQESLYSVTTNRDAMMFISETFYPGWKAYVDEKETKIYRANFAFRAIEIPQGEHTVKFAYFPDTFKRGLILSGVTAIIVLLFYPIYTLVKRRYE